MRTVKKILVVDDDQDIRDLIMMILAEEGYIVSGLNNGSQVHSTVNEFQPDLLLLDVQLGDADGRDICKQLKHDPSTEKLPVIIVSATHGSHTRHEKGCNANHYIDKPFDIFKLVEDVKRFAA